MKKRIFYHTAFWIAYVLLKAYLNFEAGVYAYKGAAAYKFFLISLTAQLPFLLVKIPLVYSLFWLSEKYLSGQWKIFKTAIFSIVLFSVSIIGFVLINHFIVLKHIYQVPQDLSRLFMIGSLFYTFFLLIIISGIALSIKLVRANLRQKEKEQEITKKKLETELQFLRSQTNPHFLFNTLNNIYALARKKSDKTADVVMKLAKILRFMLYESQKDTIPISDEVQMLDDYIELNKIRHSSMLNLSFTRSLSDGAQPIAPLILLPFVENAFKHGASESRFGSEIIIDLKLEGGILLFSVFNTLSQDVHPKNSEGLGLKNIKRQLELLYPSHQLTIKNDAIHFAVTLRINLLQDVTI